MCTRPHGWYCLGFACFCLCLPLAMAWAEGTNSGGPSVPLPAHGSNSTSTEIPPTDPWASFEQAWSGLKGELTQWSEDSLRLYSLLEALQTEAEGLRSSLTLSTEQLLASEQARLRERQATESLLVDAQLRVDEAALRADNADLLADRAARSERLWRRLAFTAAGLGALGWLTAWASLR